MKDVCVAFKILLDGQSVPIGYQKIPCHMIFDIKMEDFCHKARLVAEGHRTEAPATITYTSVVSCETVCILLLMAPLNDLEAMSLMPTSLLQLPRRSGLCLDPNLAAMPVRVL